MVKFKIHALIWCMGRPVRNNSVVKSNMIMELAQLWTLKLHAQFSSSLNCTSIKERKNPIKASKYSRKACVIAFKSFNRNNNNIMLFTVFNYLFVSGLLSFHIRSETLCSSDEMENSNRSHRIKALIEKLYSSALISCLICFKLASRTQLVFVLNVSLGGLSRGNDDLHYVTVE